MNTPEFIIVHHTGGTNALPLADTSHHTAVMVDKDHKARGWGQMGYHWFIEKSGRIVQGRPETLEGAHTIGFNNKSIGICLAGNFDLTVPTAEQEYALTWLLVKTQAKYNVKNENIIPHRLATAKTCYGNRLANEWARNLLPKRNPPTEILKALDGLRKMIEVI